jgi:AcrR family transcriptional regulator
VARKASKAPARRRRAAAGAPAPLANALIEAAAALITERGPQGFSLREVARRARVSEAAPYWHFRSKEALLAAVAEQGFLRLAAAMTEVRERVPDPRRRLQELGVAYVRFALAHPSHLRIMFGADFCDRTAHPSLHAAGEHAFALLVTSIAEGQRAGHVRRGDPEALAVAAWSMVHGLSALLIDRQLEDYARTPRDVERLAAETTKLLETGLSAPAAPRG